MPIGGKAKRLSPAPAETGYGDLAVNRREFLHVVGHRVKVGRNSVRVEVRDSLPRVIGAGKIAGTATFRTETGEQIGRYRDVTGGGELIGHTTDPIADTKDLMDYNDRGGLLTHLGIDHKRLDCAIVVLHGHPLLVSWRFFKRLLGPVLSTDRQTVKHQANYDGRNIVHSGWDAKSKISEARPL